MIERLRTGNRKMTFDHFRECSIDIMESANISNFLWKTHHGGKDQVKRLDEINRKLDGRGIINS
jgi:hypothetical protein